MAGWAYQLIVQVGFGRDSWTAPLDVQRTHPREDAEAVGVQQIKRLLARLPADGTVPPFVFDTGYDSVALADGLRDSPAAILVRLRCGRCFYGDPPPPNRPRHSDPGRGGAAAGKAQAQLLWLFYFGPDKSDLAVIWRAYVHRFDVEHTIRFFKQTLKWTTPRVRRPEQADLRSWLVLAAYTRLRLARSAVADRRLPRERPLEEGKLAPYRVRRGLPSLGEAIWPPVHAGASGAGGRPRRSALGPGTGDTGGGAGATEPGG